MHTHQRQKSFIVLFDLKPPGGKCKYIFSLLPVHASLFPSQMGADVTSGYRGRQGCGKDTAS